MFQFKCEDIIDVNLLGVRKRKVICPSRRECCFIEHCLQFLQGDSSKVFPEDSTTMFYFKSLKNNRLSVRFYIGKENKITEQVGGSNEEILIYSSDKYINFNSILIKSFFTDDIDSEEILKREDNWKSILQYFYKFMVDNDYLEKIILLDPRKSVDENYKREDNPIHSKEVIDRVNEILYACDLKYEKIGYNLECLFVNDNEDIPFSYSRCGSGFQVLANILPYLVGIKDTPNNTLFITSATFNSIHYLLRHRLVKDIMVNLKGKVILSEYYETVDIMKLIKDFKVSEKKEPIYITEEYKNADENPGKYL